MICIKAEIPKELNDIDDELKAIYHSKDTICFYVFKSRDLRNEFVEKTKGMNKSDVKKYIKIMNNKIFEWAGVITAILYSLFVALNIGIEFFGFCLLLLSAILIGIWAYRGGHKGILFLQFFYATAGIIGMVRWF